MYRIFVGNLSYRATEDALRSLFAEHGTVENVNILTDRNTGQSRGFGFVEMSDSSAGRKAIDALNETKFERRMLYVSEARLREDRGYGGDRRESGSQRRRY